MRGAHDLNVIAAIILPRSDESVSRKVKEGDGKFMFGIDERRLLWKQDLCFPPWAWVYENSTTTFTRFSERLIEATKKDGYALSFVPLYGPDVASPSNPPDPVYGCDTIILSDAARVAEYQLFSGRLTNFNGCTKWTGVRVDEDVLRRTLKVKASHDLRTMKTINPDEARRMLEDGIYANNSLILNVSKLTYPATGPGYVEEVTEMAFRKAVKEMKAVVRCRREVQGRSIRLRFVKCEDVDLRADYNDVSSSIVRDLMRKKHSIMLREALDWIALSSDLLWRCKRSWIDKTRLGTGCCIKFQESTDELQLAEKPRSYEQPPSFDNPPPLEELGLVKAIETSLSVEEPQSFEEPHILEAPQLPEQPQSLEEPKILEEPPNANNKKRRFSATGLEAAVKVLNGSIGGRVFVEGAEAWVSVKKQKHRSSHF